MSKQKALAFDKCQFEIFRKNERTQCGNHATFISKGLSLCDECVQQARMRGFEVKPITYEKV